jgi:4-amino-4-deoxy-L-arabinose transferase-like glycosyltransferase
MWAAGAAQWLSGADSQADRAIASSKGVALWNSFVLLAAVWILYRLLRRDGEESPWAAITVGLLLALDPFLLYLTGLVGTDGVLVCLTLVSFFALCDLERTGSRRSLLIAAVVGGAAGATKAPALLLIPLPLVLWLAGPREGRTRWSQRLARSGAMVLGAVGVTSLLLPAVLVDPVGIAEELYRGGGATESLSRILVTSHKEFLFGESTARPGALFYPVNLLLRTTPLALIGALGGLASRRYRRSRLVREAAIFFVLSLSVLILVNKTSWRYMATLAALLDVLGGLGLVIIFRDLAERLQRPRIAALALALIVLQGIWVLSAAPTYLLRFNPLAGGTRAAVAAIPVGWGEGMFEVQRLMEAKAKRLGRTLTWSGGYGTRPEFRKGLEFESDWLRWVGRNPGHTRADCHVFYMNTLQRWRTKPTDRAWRRLGGELATVEILGVELAKIHCREAILGAD